jgi:hypothetical protein
VTLFGITRNAPKFWPESTEKRRNVILWVDIIAISQQRAGKTREGGKPHSPAAEGYSWCEWWKALKRHVVQTTTHTSYVETRDRMGKKSGTRRRTSSEQKSATSCHNLFSNTLAL